MGTEKDEGIHMEKIKAFCVKYGALILIFLMCLMLRGCIEVYRGTQPKPEAVETVEIAPDNGSFIVGVPGTVRSDDGKLYAEQSLEQDAESGVNLVKVTVYGADNGLTVGEFIAQRALDFQGICFEPGSWNIWVQSGDVGVYCMRYDDGKWVEDHDIPIPDTIVTRH